MRPPARFCLNLLAPPALAVLLLVALGSLVGASSFRALASMPAMLAIAYLYAGLPSLVHACILHFTYRRGLAPQSGRALALSTLNGLLAGLAIALFFATAGGGGATDGPWIMVPVGAATGAINALLHRIALPRRRPWRTRGAPR